MQQPFVDTMPNTQNAVGGDAEGDRQGARRRNRRGGRGRDRDEAIGSDVDGRVPAVDNGSPASHDALTEANGSVTTHTDDAPATIEDAGRPSDSRGEGAGSRRRRGGRGRERQPRDGLPEIDVNVTGSPAPADDAGLEAIAATEAPLPVIEHAGEFAMPSEMMQPATEAPTFEAEHLPETRPRPAPTPAPVTAVAVPHRDYVLPIDSLEAVAQGAGLQWVSSDADKIRAVQEAIAATPAPIHAPREIRKAEPIDQGPLMLVETRKDLSQVRLPFETQTPGG